jgi:hypothetical protein
MPIVICSGCTFGALLATVLVVALCPHSAASAPPMIDRFGALPVSGHV